MFKTVFPRTKFADEADLTDQLHHVKSEMHEVIWAMTKEQRAEELCDLIHSAETLLHILSEKHGVDVAAIQRQVVIKNRNRSYYSTCLECAFKKCETTCYRCSACVLVLRPCTKDEYCFSQLPKEATNATKEA